MNGRMADFYQTKVSVASQFQRIRFQPDHRAGVLSHPFLMTGFAYQSTTSPIHRGVFVARNLLGRVVRPPPDAVTPLPPDIHADLTTRERTILQTKPENCSTCHQMINPLGFPLENFDAVGRFRESEKEQPIDARGSYRTRSGQTVTFNGPREMAKFVANSPEVHQAFVEQLFHHSVQQPVLAFGLQTPQQLTKHFQRNQFSVQKLLTAIAIRAAGHEFLPQDKTAQK